MMKNEGMMISLFFLIFSLDYQLREGKDNC